MIDGVNIKKTPIIIDFKFNEDKKLVCINRTYIDQNITTTAGKDLESTFREYVYKYSHSHVISSKYRSIPPCPSYDDSPGRKMVRMIMAAYLISCIKGENKDALHLKYLTPIDGICLSFTVNLMPENVRNKLFAKLLQLEPARK